MTKRYAFAPGRFLIIADSALTTLAQHVQDDTFRSEAGGILLGRHLLESPDIVIDEATVPQSSDRRKRFLFFRSSTHNSIAESRWKQSGGKVAYVGLWHSHPEPEPSPSGIDLDDWGRALSRDRFDGPHLFFLIVGTGELGCWVGNKRGNINKLKEIDDCQS